MSYHHGDLRAVLVAAAADTIAHQGVAAVTLRGLARSAGVSHSAPTHHFGDRRGLLTAVAAEGFRQLAVALGSAPTLLDMADAYVAFGTGVGAGHYAVMFDADAVDPEDPELQAARAASNDVLVGRIAAHGHDDPDAPLAAFALVHGLVALHQAGALDRSHPDVDPRALVRRIGPLLFSD
ncbi:TetR/AcrR family transcriptional regulator [Curtobacterium sp. VKM Ac-2922]|uniref:TetR/AcrR family transcriptional regulator n=1 Tax=Curtobacterium sp. VKM Ac-2922 TaxID=2929475 RepID=UPI001FB3D66F|nr:TetR/AcrR family transcriptional regulator [Curtobacterium sp. VKM Ac-2922]MCJ1715536.1 TetR/AcrR family transcriptional regulator [Curtobacterium sp. VKM Ac-2922]